MYRSRVGKAPTRTPKTIGKIGRAGTKGSTTGPAKDTKNPYKFIPKTNYSKEDIDCLFQTVTSNTISSLDKLDILEKAVAPCPEINIQIKDQKPRSLLDSGSMVTLMTQWYFEECLKSKIPEPQPGGINAHNLFNLKGVGENQVPLSRYFTCDITIGGMVVPDVGVLVKSDRILTTSKGVKTKVPVIIGCNVFKHAARKFIQDYGETALELFECPKEIDPLFFSCVELYYFSKRDRKATAPSFKEREANGKRGVGAAHMASSQVGDESAIGPNSPQGKSGRKSKSNFPPKKKFKNDNGDLGGFAGRVTVGDKKNPMCIPANSSKTIIGKVPRVDRRLTYLVEKTEDSNLPIGVGVNNTLVTPSKSGLVSVILINNNNHNIWIRQPLYTADLWEVEPKEWEYEPVLTHEEGTNNVTINFVQVPPEEFHEDIFSNATEAEENGPASETGNKNSQGEEKPKFGSPLDYDSPDFDFKGECEQLLFLLNVGEAPLGLEILPNLPIFGKFTKN